MGVGAGGSLSRNPGKENPFNRKLDIVYSVPFLRDLKAEPMGNIQQL